MKTLSEQGFMSVYNSIYVGFMVVFVAFVLLTNTIGTKLFSFMGYTLPVSILWYPFTFLITDIVSEMYGSKRARFLVIMGFATSIMLLAFSMIGIYLPKSEVYHLNDEYYKIFGPVWRIFFGSMAAYVLAQYVDVYLFHYWKKLTKGDHLWIRNNGSTMISQFVDSVTVNFIFLYNNPSVLKIASGQSEFWIIMGIVINSYVAKFIIALFDTPFCYLGVRVIERITGLKGKEID